MGDLRIIDELQHFSHKRTNLYGRELNVRENRNKIGSKITGGCRTGLVARQSALMPYIYARGGVLAVKTIASLLLILIAI